jgi:hypothetical protein
MRRRRRIAWCRSTLLAAAVMAVLVAPNPASATNERARVFPPGAHPYGQSYSQWAADWWTWVLTQPAAVNPLLDPTGAHCAQGQSGRVWFLVGTFGGGTATRSCTVPKGTALLFPVLNSFSGATRTDPPEQQTEAYQRMVVTPPMRAATNLRASIDGIAVPDIKRRYFEESVVFRVVLPADNIFGVNRLCEPSTTPDAGCVVFPTVDAGYYLMVKPLKPGTHIIHFTGTAAFGTVNVTYTINVVK